MVNFAQNSPGGDEIRDINPDVVGDGSDGVLQTEKQATEIVVRGLRHLGLTKEELTRRDIVEGAAKLVRDTMALVFVIKGGQK